MEKVQITLLLLLDYKALLPASGTLTRGTSFRQTTFPGEDPCQVMLLLQYRWEDGDGNIHAKRVGTAFARISRSSGGWVKDCRVPHAVLYISSGSRGAFEGKIGNTLWIDNVRLEYER